MAIPLAVRSSSAWRRGRSAVGELAEELPVSRPAVSQHLKVLKDAGLVIDEPVGTRRIYRVDADGLAALRADLDRFWGSALAAYKVAVEQANQEDPMSTPAADTAVQHAIVVEAPVERAFHVFTAGLRQLQAARAQPARGRHRRDGLRAASRRPHLRPGRRRQRVPLGPRARVRAARARGVQLGHRPDWQLVTDPDRTSEVEVRFIAEAPDRTRVELEHRNLDRHGDGWEGVRDGVGTDAGLAAVPGALRAPDRLTVAP